MDLRKSSFVFFVLSVCLHSVLTSSMDDAYALHTHLFRHYNKNVRPIYNQDLAICANVIMYIKSIQDFDEVNERYSFSAALWVAWIDETLRWNTSDYNGLSQITVSYDDVWVPELTLSSPSKRSTPLGRSSDRLRVHHSGYVQWMPADLIESTCTVNVKTYPFDTQTCITTFVPLGFMKSEVVLSAQYPKILMDVYSPHALWEMTDSDIAAKALGTTDEAEELVFTIYLKRKSALAVINIILPILLLSIVNTFVFLLVPESGERIGFCITSLLAIAVYMTIVSDILPKTSQPIPLISYKLFVDLVISAFIVLCTILNLGVYHRNDDRQVSSWLQNMYKLFARCTCSPTKVRPLASRQKIKVQQQQQKQQQSRSMDMESIGSKFDLDETRVEHANDLAITWKKISFMLDWVAFFLFTLLDLINFVIFISIAV